MAYVVQRIWLVVVFALSQRKEIKPKIQIDEMNILFDSHIELEQQWKTHQEIENAES